MSGGNYLVRVVAVSDIAHTQSAPSGVTKISVASVPQAPLIGPMLRTYTSTEIQLDLATMATTDELDVISYFVYYKAVGATVSPTRVVVYSTIAILTSLKKATAYEIYYQATNVIGASDKSPTMIYFTASTIPSAPLPMPTSGVFAAGHDFSVGWREPLDNGGSPITAYLIGMAVAGVYHLTQIATVSEGVARSTNYSYQIPVDVFQ